MFPDFVTTAQDGGKVVSLTHRPPLPPGNTPGTHSCQRLSRPQDHSAIGRIMSMKNSMTPSGIEPANFQFVAQHLNHCATAVPIEQVSLFNYLGNMISYEGELDIDNKLNNFLKITGILNNVFRPQKKPLRKQ